MKKKTIAIILIIMFYSARLMAQPDLGDGGDDVNDVPFDGGVSVLLAAGVAYGLKKVYDTKKQKNHKGIN